MPVSANKTRWFFSLYLNGLKQAFLLSGNHDWIFATCNFYISCHEHREHAWIKFNKQVSHGDCYLFLKAWMVRGNTSKLFRTLIVWRSIKPFESTAVASMRRTEALASVKFYQILSIFIFFYQTDNIRRFHTADFVQRTVCSPRLYFLPGYGPGEAFFSVKHWGERKEECHVRLPW